MLKSHTIENILIKLETLAEIVLIVGVFCLIFIMAHRAIFDLDIWLHLKTGEYIVQNKSVPTSDMLSFSLQGKPWTDHSWLFQILAYLVYNKWQADGLIFFESLLVALSFFILFLIGYKIIDSYLEVGVLLVATAFACVTRFNIRPDLFSFLFFSLYLYFLWLQIDKKIIWCLVPIQLLWVNCHGYFFLGPLLVLFFIFADFLRRKLIFLPRVFRENFVLSEETLRRLKILFLFLVLVCFLNPRGWRGAVYPLFVLKEALLGRMQIFLQYIQELQPTFSWTIGKGKFYNIMAVLCLASMAINFKRLKIIDIILFVFFFFFSLSLRNIVFFLFVCNVIIISNVAPLLRNIAAKIESLLPFKQKLYILFLCLATLVFVVWIGLRIDKLLSQNYYDFDSKEVKSSLMGIDQRNYPKKSVDFILENDIPGHMFNDFNSGAYLIGRAYPKRKVFIDGRTEFYGPGFFKEYINALKKDVPAFERIVNNYNITSVFVSMALTSTTDLVKYLYKNPAWQLIYFDEGGVIFLKDVPENRELLNSYKIDLNKYTVPRMDLKELRLRQVYPLPYVKRATLFDIFRENELVMAECKEALRIMPNCAQCFYVMAKVHIRNGAYQEALENLRSCLLFLPGHIEALVDLGICYQELGDAKVAIDMFKKAIRINKRYAPAYYRLGCAYLFKGEEKEAPAFIKKAIKYEPEEAKYYFKLAEALFGLGEKSKINLYMKQIKSNLSKATELNLRFQDQELSIAIKDLAGKISR